VTRRTGFACTVQELISKCSIQAEVSPVLLKEQAEFFGWKLSFLVENSFQNYPLGYCFIHFQNNTWKLLSLIFLIVFNLSKMGITSEVWVTLRQMWYFEKIALFSRKISSVQEYTGRFWSFQEKVKESPLGDLLHICKLML
jgi:hypothetical protein